MSNCIKITYYKMEEGDQKLITLPSIYLPEGADFGTDSETESFVIESLLKIAKDPTNEGYQAVQNMLNSEVISTRIKKEISDVERVNVSDAIKISNKLPGSLLVKTNSIKKLFNNRSNETVSFKLMRNLLNTSNTEIIFSPQSFDSKGNHLPESFESVQGLYFSKENVIVIKTPNIELESESQLDFLLSTNEDLQESLIHELVHYQTVANFTPELISSFSNISPLKDIKDNQVKDIVDEISGLSKSEQAKEFIAYYLSNSNFRNAVNNSNNSIQNEILGLIHKVVGTEHLGSYLNVLSTKQNARILLESDIPNDSPVITNDEKLSIGDSEDDINIENYVEESDDSTADDADTNSTLMRNVPSNDLFLTVKPIKINTIEGAKKYAGSIYNNFKNATDSSNKSIKYTLNYGASITTVGYNRALLHKLQQNDIIRIPINSKNKTTGEWEITDKSTYLPIINSYIDSKTKELKLQVATKNGKTLVIDANDVIAYRSFLGNLNINKLNTPKSEIAETWANYANMTFGEDYTFNGSKIELPEVPKLYEKMTLRDNNYDTKIYDNEVATYVSFNIDKRFNQLANEKLKEGDSLNVYTGRDDIYDTVNFDSLKRGDVLKVVSKDKTGKKLTYFAPILNVYGDVVEVVSSPKNSKELNNITTHFINKNNISGVYLLRQNHDERLNELEQELKQIMDDGINQTTGLTKTSFLNYTPKGILSNSPNWNDLDAITAGDPDFFDNYTKWRSSLTDQEYNSLREENLDSDTIKLLRYARAIDRRRSITDKLGVGGIVQLETVRWISNPDVNGSNWIKDANNGFRTVNGVVLSKNGDWLKVRIAKQSFSDGQPISGEYNYETISVKVTTNHPSLNDNNSTNYAIRAVFKNNIKHVPLVNYFKQLKNTVKTNFENFQNLIDHYNNSTNTNLDLNPSSDQFSLFGIKESGKDYRMNKSKNGYIPNSVKTMGDVYDIRLFDEDISSDEKLRMMARLKVGSIVLTKIDENANTSANYGTAIVVDFDTRTGKPIIGYAFTPKYKSKIDVTDFNSIPESYATKSIHPSEIVGVGYSKSNHRNSEGDVIFEMDDFINNDNYKRAEMYINSKSLSLYDTISEANEKLSKLSKTSAKLLEVYISQDGRRVTDKSKTKGTLITKYAVVFQNISQSGKQYNVDTNSPYTDVWASTFENKPTKTILSALRPGDVLVEKYEKNNVSKYIDLVIDDIKGKLIYVTAYYPKKGTTGEGLKDLDNYEQYPKIILANTQDGLGLSNIINIKLNYYKQGDVKSRKAIITGAESTTLPNNSNFKSNDTPKSYNSKTIQGGDRKTFANSLPKVNTKTQNQGGSNGADMSSFFSKASDFKSSSSNDLEQIRSLSNRLSEVYNVPVELLDSNEIHERFGTEFTNYNISNQRAFLKDGQIFINTDYATTAEPIHELGHLIIQGLELTDVELYSDIISKMPSHPFYEKIKVHYPELNDKQLLEETFVTVLGEHYFNSPDNTKTKEWENVNTSFFHRVFKSIRNFFAKMFGIEDHKFFRISDRDLMNSSLDDLLDNFTNRLLNGKFKTEVELVTEKTNHLMNNTYLKNISGSKSSLYLSILESGMDDKFASDSWINSKNSTFVNWHNNEIVTSDDGEPKIFFRTGNPYEITSDDITNTGDMVFVKGNLTPTDTGSFITDSEENIKSIYSMNIKDSPNLIIKTIEEYALSKGLFMIGSSTEVNNTIGKLREQFGNYNFTSYNLNDDSLFYVKYYKSPSQNVLKLRNELFSKNLIEAVC